MRCLACVSLRSIIHERIRITTTDSLPMPSDDVHVPLLAEMDMDEPAPNHVDTMDDASPGTRAYQPPVMLDANDAPTSPPEAARPSLDHAASGFEAHVRAYMADRLHDSCGASDAMSEPPPSLQAAPAVALAETARSMAGSPVTTRTRFRSAERLSWQRGSAGGLDEDGRRKTAFKSIPSSIKSGSTCSGSTCCSCCGRV